MYVTRTDILPSRSDVRRNVYKRWLFNPQDQYNTRIFLNYVVNYMYIGLHCKRLSRGGYTDHHHTDQCGHIPAHNQYSKNDRGAPPKNH